MTYLDEVKQFQKVNRVFKEAVLVGYDSAELTHAETVMGLPLPPAFRDYLAWAGKRRNNVISRTGHQWSGDSAYKVSNATHIQESRKLLADDGLPAETLLPDNCIVFWYYQGYAFRFMRCDEGDDPPMYTFTEGDEAVVKSHDRFSDYLLDAMKLADRQAARVWLPRLSQLETLTQPDERIERLSFNGTIKFATIPDKVFDFVNLTSLNLAHTNLRRVDERIGQFEGLTELYLTNNQLTALPEALAQLPALQLLDVSRNRLSAEHIAKVQAALPNCEIRAVDQQV